MRLVPSRQGTHLPQNSVCVYSMKRAATSTMQRSSSSTVMTLSPRRTP